MNTVEAEKKYIAQTYSRYNLCLVNGNGEYAYDENGKEYIDMGSGIGVNIFGYCDKIWQDAVISQLQSLQHTSNLYYTEPMVKLAESLCKKTGLSKVFFSNSGAEANECAIKCARKYSHDKYGDGRYKIITLVNSFHGRTLATLTATGQDVFHKDFGPFVDGFEYATANDIDSVKTLTVNDDTCAIMIECIQGEGGVLPLNGEFVKAIADLCRQKDILLIVDEVQTGNGRTGKMYAYEHFGISPDIVTTAKGIGGGLPLGVTMFGEKTKDVFTYGTHGTTFGANPVSCAGALSIVKRIDDKLLVDVKKKGEYIRQKLSLIKGVKNISGMGLMLGFETDKPNTEVINECIEKGLILLSAKSKIRLLPALNISYDSLDKAINIIKEVLEQ